MRVKKVEYIKDFKLKITFGDNVTKIVDLENFVKRSTGVFTPLKEIDFFKQVSLDDCQFSICWPNGADICPDILYALGKNIKKTQTISRRLQKKTVKSTKKD